MFIDLFQAISRSYSTKKLMQLHLSNKSTGSNGFTLVETVVVIAVIATLTAIAIPLFFGIQEAAADKLVRYSMIKAYKECKIDIIKGDQTPTFTVMLGLHNTNGYYRFYQQYDYIPRKDGYIPPTKIGNCIAPPRSTSNWSTKNKGARRRRRTLAEFRYSRKKRKG